jgi:hypothetical protein
MFHSYTKHLEKILFSGPPYALPSTFWKAEKCLTVFDLNNNSYFECLAGVEYNDIMIYLLTATGLSPGGSTHLQTNNT